MGCNCVHFIGDSTLDNGCWTEKKNSVEDVLQKLVGGDYQVNNLAYDGFTTQAVLSGSVIGEVLPNKNEKAYKTYIKEKTKEVGGKTKVCPLEELKKKITQLPNTPHYVVLSVGGNDFRENLLNPLSLLQQVPQVQERYLQILTEIQNMQGKKIYPILMLQYRTDANHDPYRVYSILGMIGGIAVAVHLFCIALLVVTIPIWMIAGKISAVVGGFIFLSGAVGLYMSQKVIPLSVTKDVLLGKKIGMVVLGALMQTFYRPILERARKDGIPILDLANTFNPHQGLYTCGIEPNEKGSRLIAEGIQHILQKHEFETKESILYSKSSTNPTYVGKKNIPSAWKVVYI